MSGEGELSGVPPFALLCRIFAREHSVEKALRPTDALPFATVELGSPRFMLDRPDPVQTCDDYYC